ncbi:MAG TPA: hypothetical protein VNS53_06820 [Sphingomicrobium sp.]|jgi:hypothetical protein|nr:hypothetical protein [Sphingomicrobium sp.]
MRKQMIQDAAYEVATQVRAVEETIDSALNEVAELQARIMHANSVAGVGYGVIHPTLQNLATAVAGLVETRGAIVACHEALADARGKVPGLRTVSWGDGEDCPPNTARADLRIVA